MQNFGRRTPRYVNFIKQRGGKDIKFIKSQDVGYEYIVDYTIPQTSKMETGYLTFEVYGYTDKAGNGGDVLTVANHSKYNKVYYDGIAPTIKLVGTLGKNQNEHRVPVGSWIDLSDEEKINLICEYEEKTGINCISGTTAAINNRPEREIIDVVVKIFVLSYLLSSPYRIIASPNEKVNTGIRKRAIVSKRDFVYSCDGLICLVYRLFRKSEITFEPKFPIVNITVLNARFLYLFILSDRLLRYKT